MQIILSVNHPKTAFGRRTGFKSACALIVEIVAFVIRISKSAASSPLPLL
jgi:hypothetical protein